MDKLGGMELKQWLLTELGDSEDIIFREVYSTHNRVHFLYIKTLCDDQLIQNRLVQPFYELEKEEFQDYLQSLPNQTTYQTNDELLTEVLNGSLALLLDDKIVALDMKKTTSTPVSEASVEIVIQGPLISLTESVTSNINIIRHRYPQASLRIKETKIGRLSQTKVSIVYDTNFAPKNLVQEIEKTLSEVDIDLLQAAGELQKLINQKKKSLFPTMMITERPDRITYNLARGKVVILIEGTPFCLIAPAVFYDFMASMEDNYQSFWVNTFIISMRYIGLFICLLLPSFYVGVTAFNPEFFRVQLALSIAGSRIGVPYPAFIEIIFMLLMMEMLTEASVRLPKTIGSTATTVGGLILGQAAVEAGLVSNVMIIIVSTVAISNFVIPINSMTFAIRVIKYPLLALTCFLGTIGLVIGFTTLIAYLANLRSYGQPYLKIFALPKVIKKEMG